ncbi:hypothetical protein DSECCO2_439130 [anaerobic digester metagenome]
MSNIEKAIEVLKQQVKIYSCSQSDCPCDHTDTCQHIHLESMEPASKGFTVYEANQTAIVALEKQVPQIVENETCPNCGNNLFFEDQNYCEVCGQKLEAGNE